jgi:cytosolic 5'-nucleotidase 3
MATIIPNEELLKAKLEKFNRNNFHIVADFDKTITKAVINGKKHSSSWALIREEDYLGEEYSRKAHKLFEKYHPIEISKTIPYEERYKEMINWWKEHKDLLVECGLSKEIIEKTIKKDKVEFRENYETFFQLLKENNIPILIFSAGIGNIIEGILKLKKQLTSNIQIIANFFKFDENGKTTGYKYDRVVNTYNKNEHQLEDHPYQKEIKDRKNVLLLGDQMGDLGMTEGIEHNEIIKVGFANTESDKEVFQKHFDLVITEDGPLDEINKIIKEILNK